MIGKMDTYVQVYVISTETRDSNTGQMVQVFRSLHFAWAELITKNQTEKEMSRQITNPKEVIFRMRYNSSYHVKMKIVISESSDTYIVTGIVPEGRKNYSLIHAISTAN